MKRTNIFDAARAGDVEVVQACIDAGVDLAAVNENGFTALQYAAMGANTADVTDIVAILRLLLEAGSPLEYVGGDRRTALYLAAEFSSTVHPVQLLLEAGAKADIYDAHGNHIVVNAMLPEVQMLLSKITGKTFSTPEPQPKPVKLNAAEWREVKVRIDAVFDVLTKSGLIVLQDAGVTQSDGFSDCAEVFHERGGERAGFHGFCFYTRQDLNRAKRTSQLALAFWGAPEGAPKDMQRVGNLIVEACRNRGFIVDWNGSGSMRPTVFLQAGY